VWARPDQLSPEGNWQRWLIQAGRGWGKTRTAAQWIIEQTYSKGRRLALIGRTTADVRDTMVEGESGIIACSHPKWRPRYEPSKRRLTWPNGTIATTYSADEPDLLRGPQHHAAWADELASWFYPDAWDQLLFGLRLGKDPRVVISTTPRPTSIIRDLIKDPTTVVTRGRTRDNAANLPDAFLNKIISKYEGTRLGRQELDGEVLDDTPGALWNYAMLDSLRVKEAPQMARIVVALDPAVTANEDSDETGIVAVGLGYDGKGYVLRDATGIYTPNEWAQAAVHIAHDLRADAIVAEVNQGGDMVERIIRTVDQNIRFRSVRATRGKALRAEPVAALYEQGRIHHIGAFAKLEDQMCTWSPLTSSKSPDRLDALVWGITELMLGSNEQEYFIPQGLIA
jgi:phage terminase large subunit-like protein